MKVTVEAPANIAFIKYWGARDLESALPENASVSMTLDHCRAHTTVEFSPGAVEAISQVVRSGMSSSSVSAPSDFSAAS